MNVADAQTTASIFRRARLCLLSLILIAFGPALQAEPLSALNDVISKAGESAAAQTGQAEPEKQTDQEALDRAIALLEDEQARQTLLQDLKALQQGMQVQKSSASEAASGVLSNLSIRMSRVSESFSLDEVLNRWKLLLINAGKDFEWLLETPRGRKSLVTELGHFLVMLVVTLLPAVIAWLLLRRPVRRLEMLGRPALATGLRCVPFLIPFAAALAALPVLGADTGSRLGVVLTYVSMGGAGLYLVVALLVSLVEQGVRRRLTRLLLPRVRGWLIAIGASLAAADAFANAWVAEPLAQTLPSLLSTWFYLLSAMLCGLLAFRHHRLATMMLRPRRYDDDPVMPFWLSAGRVAARSWQWAVIIVSTMSFFGILLLQGEEQAILRSGIFTALLVVATTLLASLASSWIRMKARQLRAPPNRSYYLSRYLRMARVLITLAIWILGFELIVQAWGSSLVYIFRFIIGEELTEVLVSLLVIGAIAWLCWVTLKSAIERALAGETENLQSQSARSRTLLPLLRSVGLVVIVLVAVISALSSLGVNVTPLLAGAGVLGLAIGFGSQKLVQDLITGLFILFEDTISIGDYINVAGHEGIVEGMSVRTVRMRDLDGTLHAVPFGQINSVRNLSKDYSYALMNITVSYEEDVDNIIREFEEIGEELRKDPLLGWAILEPLEVFGLQQFTPNGMVVRVRFMTRPMRQWDVMRGFNLMVKRRFDELGIRLPVQQVMVQQADNGKREAPDPDPKREGWAYGPSD